MGDGVKDLERIEKLKIEMLNIGDCAIVSPGTNFYYLTKLKIIGSLERLFLLFVCKESNDFIIAPKLYESELDKLKMDIFLWKDDENPYEKLKNLLKIENKTILIGDNMPTGTFLRINEIFKGNRFLPLSSIMNKIRMLKDDEEIGYIKKSANIVDNVFDRILKEKVEGLTEVELSRIIEEYIFEYGGEGKAFDTIVATGKNSANPHHKPENVKIKKGDVLILDYGAVYNGYCSDITRTLFIGEISSEKTEIYKIVKNAQEEAIKNVRPGIKAGKIDEIARGIISNYGYGNYFTHRTGHGIGLDVHEEPFINPSNNLLLENRMVHTIEPGIYIPNRFGIRIEDDILIENVVVQLTKATKDILVI